MLEEEGQRRTDGTSPAEAARSHTVPHTAGTCYKGMGTVVGPEARMEAQPGLPMCILGASWSLYLESHGVYPSLYDLFWEESCH